MATAISQWVAILCVAILWLSSHRFAATPLPQLSPFCRIHSIFLFSSPLYCYQSMWQTARKDTSGMSKFQLQMSGQWNQQVLGKEMGAAAGVAAISLDGQASNSLPSTVSSSEGDHVYRSAFYLLLPVAYVMYGSKRNWPWNTKYFNDYQIPLAALASLLCRSG